MAANSSALLNADEILGVDDDVSLVLGDGSALLDEDAILGGDELLSPVAKQPPSCSAAEGKAGALAESIGSARRIASLDASFHNELDYDEEAASESAAVEATSVPIDQAEDEKEGPEGDDGEEKRVRESRFTSERATAPPPDQTSKGRGRLTAGYFPRHTRPGNKLHSFGGGHANRRPADRTGGGAAKLIHINPNFKGTMPANIMASLQHGTYVSPQSVAQQQSFPPLNYPYLASTSTVYIRPPLPAPAVAFNSSIPPPGGVVMGTSTASTTGSLLAAPGTINQASHDPSVDWTSMVDAFVQRTSRRDTYLSTRRKRSSPSSSSSSFRSTSSSRSPSASTHSSSSKSNRGGRRTSPKRVRREHRRQWSVSPLREPLRRERPPQSPQRTGPNESSKRAIGNRRRQHESRGRPLRKERELQKPPPEGKKSVDREQMVECAQAIGLDEDYLKKLEEQRKQREELARRRRERRGQPQSAEKTRPSEEEPSTPPPAKLARRERRPVVAAPSTPPQSTATPSPSTPNKSASTGAKPSTNSPAAACKLKPYLAVLVKNLPRSLGAMPDALLNRVKKMAQDVGPVKKLWQSSDTRISILFDHHEHAKSFMLQYHGKSMNDHKLDIALEKILVNLADVP